jgi:hypothetical protein
VETVDPETRMVNSLEGETFEYDLLVPVGAIIPWLPTAGLRRLSAPGRPGQA